MRAALPLFGYRRRDDARGVFLSAQDGADVVTGWSAEALISGSVGYWDLTPPEQKAEIAGEIAAARRTGSDFAVLYALRRRDGRPNLVIDRGAWHGTDVIEGWICQLSGVPAVERALRESERLRAIGNLTNDVVIEIDAEGRLLEVSPNAERVFGNPREGVVGRSGLAGVRAEDREIVREALRRLVPGGPPNSFTVRLGPNAGRATWVEGSVAAFRASDGSERYAAVVRDASERQERTRALAESEAKFAAAFQSSPAGMALTRLDGDELIEANASFWRMLGMEADWTPDRDERMRAIWSRDVRRAPVLALLREKGELTGPARFRLPSGETRAALVAARTIPLRDRSVILWQLVDLTDEYVAQRALREKDQLYRSLVDGCPLGIVTTDDEGRVTTANAAAHRLLGAPANESLLGWDARTSSGADWESVEPELAGVIEGGGQREFEIDLQTPWAKRIRVRAHLARLDDADGKPVGALAVIEDVTEQRRMEEQLRRSQKLEALGQLAAGAAHDLQNWLLVIDACGQELEARLEAEPLSGAVAKIRRATAGASGLAQQLMRFGRLPRLCPRVLDLNEAVLRAHGLWRHLLPDDVKVDFELAASRPRVLVDPSGLDQVVLNLVINARDAMPDGGRITISTDPGPRCSHRRSRPGEPNERFARLSVSDTGTGIPDGVRRRIFEPFFTTKTDGAGSGLGLAMVDAIVGESGGHVRVGAPGSHGARFDVYLPAAEEKERCDRAPAG